MKKEVGLWIDHQKAFLVINLDQEEVIKQVTSELGKFMRLSGTVTRSDPTDYQDPSESRREHRFTNQLNRYYDAVIAYLQDATAILILGPGEAKGELQKRLVQHGLSERLVAVKTADKLTDAQIVAMVREYFQTLSSTLHYPHVTDH